jgi:hypothetical protein
MENLLARIGRMAFLLIIGVCLVTYIALGIFYWQQGLKQEGLDEQIQKTSVIVSKPLAGTEKLQAEYEAVNQALAPLAVPESLKIIVGIAEDSGIDVDSTAGKINIPAPGSLEQKKIGENNYQVLSLKNIKVRGEPEYVTAFISDLDSGETMKNMVLTKFSISQTELEVKEAEKLRREEYRDVSLAVRTMMNDNGLTEIPAPLDYAGEVATNDMGLTLLTGFPDVSTVAADRGYTGAGTPRDGYVLYQHDRIDTDNTTQYEVVSYISTGTTSYYYTCEADGTVRQFDGPDVTTAREYLDIETVVNLNVDIYTKPVVGE